MLGFTAASIIDKTRIEANRPVPTLADSTPRVAATEDEAKSQRRGDYGNAWLRFNSAGSGPFAVEEATRSEELCLSVNALHPMARRRVPIIIRHIAEPDRQLKSLLSGNVSIARDIPQALLDRSKPPRPLTILSYPKASVVFLAMNMQSPAFANARIRQALRWAVDYDALIAVMPRRFAKQQGFLPAILLGRTFAPFRQDQKRARELIAAAGGPVSFAIDHAGGAPRSQFAELLADQLSAVGLKVSLRPHLGGDLARVLLDRKHDLVLASWGSDYMDPHSNAQTFGINPDNSVQTEDRTMAWSCGWRDEEIESQVKRAANESDPKKRLAAYLTVQEQLAERGPFLFLAEENGLAAVRPGGVSLRLGPTSGLTRYGT